MKAGPLFQDIANVSQSTPPIGQAHELLRKAKQSRIRHNLLVNYGLDLPFGNGQMYLSHLNGVTNSIVGGWRVNGITTLRSGVPIALTANPNTLAQFFGGGTSGFGPGNGIIRPNYTPGCSKSVSGGRLVRA